MSHIAAWKYNFWKNSGDQIERTREYLHFEGPNTEARSDQTQTIQIYKSIDNFSRHYQIFNFLIEGGCFGILPQDTMIYNDPSTGLQTQSWFYSPSSNMEQTKKKLVRHILSSSLYKSCVEKGDIPKATYSEPFMSSLVLSCWPKNIRWRKTKSRGSF